MRNIVLRRILTLSVISVLCFVIGIAYGIATGDKMLLMMSIIICVVNMYKIWDLKRIEKTNKYIILSGQCLESSYNFVGRYRTFRIQKGTDIVEISVPKSVKLKVNEEYKLYFKKNNLGTEGYNNWLKSKILSENFLGYEIVSCESAEN